GPFRRDRPEESPMTRGLSLSLIAAALLLLPVAASASDHWQMHSRHLRDDIRREVREAVRGSQRTRFAARRDVYRAWARQRHDVRQAVRQAQRDARRARRE